MVLSGVTFYHLSVAKVYQLLSLSILLFSFFQARSTSNFCSKLNSLQWDFCARSTARARALPQICCGSQQAWGRAAAPGRDGEGRRCPCRAPRAAVTHGKVSFSTAPSFNNVHSSLCVLVPFTSNVHRRATWVISAAGYAWKPVLTPFQGKRG